MFIDTHCHFDFKAFAKKQIECWRECNQKGVFKLIIPGVSTKQWSVLPDIAEAHSGIYFALGIHPWWLEEQIGAHQNIDNSPEIGQQIRNGVQHHRCVAIGECGLDKAKNSSLEQQINVLNWHLTCAEELGLPVILHCVKAHNEMLACLNEFQTVVGVVHAFSGSYEMAMEYWRRGFYIGVGGTITYERAKKTRDAIRRMPLESLLLETDAPDMPLQGRQGAPNSPEYLVDIAECLADLRGDSLDTIAKATTENAHTLFTKL